MRTGLSKEHFAKSANENAALPIRSSIGTNTAALGGFLAAVLAAGGSGAQSPPDLARQVSSARAAAQEDGASSPAARTFLICTGYSAEIKATIHHTVVIDGGRAWVDDLAYANEPTEIAYTLSGPAGRFRIDRVTGAYLKLDENNVEIEWARPPDGGCVVTKRRF
ncbi:MAG TPA: hypothetical protein VN806_14935 [Caulobacteraceae bacterium]|nr:hypothetical protein [Caulobacteraceae bacterium]